MLWELWICKKFQSTLPVGGATGVHGHPRREGNISIHAPRGGSDNGASDRPDVPEISIHAPRGGSDRTFFASG